MEISTFDGWSFEEFDGRIRSALVDISWTVSRLLTSNCLDIMPCFHVISPIFPGVPYGRREEGLGRAGRVAIHYTFTVVSSSQHLRQRTAGRRRGRAERENREEKKVSVSTGGCSARKVQRSCRRWRIPTVETDRIAAHATFVDLSSARNHSVLVIGILRKIVRDNVPIEESPTKVW